MHIFHEVVRDFTLHSANSITAVMYFMYLTHNVLPYYVYILINQCKFIVTFVQDENLNNTITKCKY